MDSLDPTAIERAAELLANTEALVICAGAGMGVDSGLPDFRGSQGFWRAYPLFEKLGMTFADVANPHWFQTDPAQAWGFYGHRLNLYRATQPHVGFTTLLKWARRASLGHMVFTSNVDGHFQISGFGDEAVVGSRSSSRGKKCHAWLKSLPSENIVVIECGAGKAIPTVRFFSQQLIIGKKAKVIRINPREEDLIFEDDGLALRSGAKAAIEAIDARL